MKKLILPIALALLVTACGTEEKTEPVKELTFCECIEAKGPPPAGCSHLDKLSEAEFEAEFNKCKDAESEAEVGH